MNLFSFTCLLTVAVGTLFGASIGLFALWHRYLDQYWHWLWNRILCCNQWTLPRFRLISAQVSVLGLQWLNARHYLLAF